jgi:predicted nucleic acid-binding protein
VKVVIDASVALKWLFADEAREPNTRLALEILQGLRHGTVQAVQPVHWLAEVAAVIAREAPDLAAPALDLVDAMELPVVNDVALIKQAASLSQQLNHHLFDTLYHALALRSGALLVTADNTYYLKARALGQISRLADWPPSEV